MKRHALLFCWLLLAPLASAQEDVAALQHRLMDLCTHRQFQDAVVLARHIVSLEPPDSAALGSALSDLGAVQDALGDHDAAYQSLTQAREVLTGTAGPEAPATASCIQLLAINETTRQHYPQAADLFRQALTLVPKVVPTDQQARITALLQARLGSVYFAMHDYPQAREAYRPAVEVLAADAAMRPLAPPSLQQLAIADMAVQQPDDAIRHARQAVDIATATSGPQANSTALSLQVLGDVYRENHQVEPAMAVYRQALEIDEKSGGPSPESCRLVTDWLSDCDLANHDVAAAEADLQRGVSDSVRLAGPQSATTARSLASLATFYQSQNQAEKARPLCEQVVAIESKLPPSLEAAVAFESLATNQASRQDWKAAEAPLHQAIALREQFDTSHSHGWVADKESLALVYSFTGRLDEAAAMTQYLYQQVQGSDDALQAGRNLAQYDVRLGHYAAAETVLQGLGDAPDVQSDLADLERREGKAVSARQRLQKLLAAGVADAGQKAHLELGLALACIDTDDFSQAVSLAQDAWQTQQARLGPDDIATLGAASTLGLAEQSMGHYDRARHLDEALLANPHLGFLQQTVLHNLASLEEEAGDPSRAEVLYRQAIDLDRHQHAEVALAQDLGGLGQVEMDYGHFDTADKLLTQALAIDVKLFGEQSDEVADNYNTFGVLHSYFHDRAKAIEYYDKAIAINQQLHGADSLSAALVTYNRVTAGLGRTPQADLEKVVDIYRLRLGDGHPRTLLVRSYLCLLYAHNRSTNTLAYARSVVQTMRSNNVPAIDREDILYRAALAMLVVGAPQEALPLLEESQTIAQGFYGWGTPEQAEALRTEALADMALQRPQDALQAERASQAIEDRVLNRLLTFTTASQRLSFQRSVSPYEVLATLGDAEDLCQTILRRKGLVLDSLVEDLRTARASQDPETRALAAQLREASQQLVHQTVSPPPGEPADQAQADVQALTVRVDDLQARLSRRVNGVGRARKALQTTPAQVQAILPAAAALVEFIRYARVHDEQGRPRLQDCYGAVLLGHDGPPRWVPLGPAARLDTLIQQYRSAAESGAGPTPVLLQSLDMALLAPVRQDLPNAVHSLFLSPDSALNFVSFAALLQPDGTFEGEHYSVRYVSSGRDLLQRPKLVSNRTMELIGNPLFGKGHGSRPIAPPLPGTEAEIRALAALAPTWGWSPRTLTGADATRQRVMDLHAPYVLHIATHGFFLGDVLGSEAAHQRGLFIGLSDAPQSRVHLGDPMVQSGLALAGAERTLEAWLAGQSPGDNGDGVLTAEEVGTIPLDGTWLTVLSACDTAQGVANDGEGVMGLRRGFVQAGVANLLMTLWPIPDRQTARFMRDFYRAAWHLHDPGQALASVQATWLKRLRQRLGVRAAAEMVGPFVLNSQGPVVFTRGPVDNVNSPDTAR